MARDRSRGPERGRGRGDDAHAARDRVGIAQTAARLIAEHGLTDWSLAKRKAARQLMLPDSTAMPSNDEIEAALLSHHALFGSEAHAGSLRAQRREALDWMTRLAAWEPLLVGGVAAGWATAHSDVRLELVADDPKAVEMALAGAGVAYSAIPPRDGGDDGGHGAQLYVATPGAGIRLSILTPQQRRNRPRRDGEPRLAANAVAALLEK
ncbi:MAG: hypothetical protein ABI886_02400 [Betaproteobacteria bacterium]